jgi:hypothetical protein
MKVGQWQDELALGLFLGCRLGRRYHRIASEARRAQGLDPADGGVLPLAVFPHGCGFISVGLFVSHLFPLGDHSTPA